MKQRERGIIPKKMSDTFSLVLLNADGNFVPNVTRLSHRSLRLRAFSTLHLFFPSNCLSPVRYTAPSDRNPGRRYLSCVQHTRTPLFYRIPASLSQCMLGRYKDSVFLSNTLCRICNRVHCCSICGSGCSPQIMFCLPDELTKNCLRREKVAYSTM